MLRSCDPQAGALPIEDVLRNTASAPWGRDPKLLLGGHMSRKLVTLGFLLTFAVLPALAQRITGSISGQVEDPKGALIQGAKVTVTNDATGYKLETTTSDHGTFSVPELPPADYKVTIQAPGFASYVNPVTVRVGF